MVQNTGLSVGVSGLNETASIHGLQDGEASVARNVTPDKGGRLRKRRGTRVLYQQDRPPSLTTYGGDLAPFTTNAGNGLLIERIEEDLFVYAVGNTSNTLLFTKLGVFNSLSSQTDVSNMMSSVVLPGQDPRLLLLTQRTRPVQLTFTERSVYELSASVTSVVFKDVAEYANATSSNVTLLFNGQRVSGVSYTFNPLTNEVTVTFPALPPSLTLNVQEFRFDLLYVTWQWWCEATQWFGSDFYQSTSRFNATNADLNTPISKDLLTDLFPNQSDTVSQYPLAGLGFPLRAMDDVNFNVNTNNRDVSKQPVASNRYWFGNGAAYTPGLGTIETAPFNWTWGGLQPGGLPSRLYQHRFRELRMRNGRGVPGGELRVTVNSVPFSHNITDTPTHVSTPDSYHLRKRGGAIILNTTDKADTLSFTSTNPVGLAYNQRVEIVDVGVFPKLINQSDIGTGCVDQRSYDWLPVDGGYEPVFGLFSLCDFDKRQFPTTGALFQGRLVLSGFVGNPTACVASAVRDTRTPNNGSFNHFLVNDAFVLPTDAFEFVVGTDTNDAVLALTTWNESLVCFTRNGVYVSYAKGDSTFSAGTSELSRVSSRGILNRRAYASMSGLLVYVSPEGLESVGTADNTAENAPLSERIKGRFQLYAGTRYANLVRLAYLEKTNAFYVFVPLAPCTHFSWEVLVLNVDTMGWTVYDSLWGFPVHDCAVVEGRNGVQTLITSMTTKFINVNSNTGKANHLHLKWEDDTRSTDYTVQTSIVGGVVLPAPLPVERRFVNHFFTGDNFILPTSFEKTGQVRGFTLTPYTNVCDVSVWVGGVPVQFSPGGVPDVGRFAKLPNGDVILNTSLGSLVGVGVNMYLKQPATIYLD